MLTLPLLLRRRLTGASATFLIIWIASLNILWQFPFLGLFAASLSVLVVGAIVNTAMRPVISVETSTPPTAAAGETFLVNFGLTTDRRMAAYHVAVGLDRGPRQRHAVVDRIAVLEEVGRRATTIHTSLLAERRGKQKIPNLQMLSTFPFELWRIFSIGDVDASILVTPDPKLDDAPESVLKFGATAMQWIDSKRQSDESDYAGSREYVIGQTVRQWDYRAWARLNRPMVRVPPRAQGGQTTLIIDPAVTLPAGGSLQPGQRVASVEWLFRVAASIAKSLAAGQQWQTFVTGPQSSLRRLSEGRMTDVEPLSQLALSEAFAAYESANDQTDDEILGRRAAALLPPNELDRSRHTNVLILTTRADFSVLEQLGLSAKIIRLDFEGTQ